MESFKGLHIIHRGNYSYKYPENSIPAFLESVRNKKMIELDTHIIKDGTVIVFHDDNLKRMCGIDICVKDLSYKDISKYKLGTSNYSIPTLKQVLDVVNGEVALDIELKYDVCDYSLENAVIDILRNYNGEYILKSFDPRIVRYLKKLRKKYCMDYKVGLLSSNRIHLISSLIYSKPDFISFNYKLLDNNIFKYFSKRKPTLLYTFKNNEDIKKISDFDGGYIVENYLEVFKK